MSIRPIYAEAILRGEKRIEFRRSRLAADIEKVVIYATHPIQRVIGWFEIAEIVEDDPIALWKRFAESACIDEEAYAAYYENSRRGYGIRIRRANRLSRPRKLVEIGKDLIAPQSFRYLSESVIVDWV